MHSPPSSRRSSDANLSGSDHSISHFTLLNRGSLDSLPKWISKPLDDPDYLCSLWERLGGTVARPYPKDTVQRQPYSRQAPGIEWLEEELHLIPAFYSMHETSIHDPLFRTKSAGHLTRLISPTLIRDPGLPFEYKGKKLGKDRWYISTSFPTGDTKEDPGTNRLVYAHLRLFTIEPASNASRKLGHPPLPKPHMVVQLTKLEENEWNPEQSPLPYFPPIGKTKIYQGFAGPITLRTLEVRYYGPKAHGYPEGRFRLTIFEVEHDGHTRTCSDLQYRYWEDGGKADFDLYLFIHLLFQLNRYPPYTTDLDDTKLAMVPIILHCLAGIGRAGTLLAGAAMWRVFQLLRTNPEELQVIQLSPQATPLTLKNFYHQEIYPPKIPGVRYEDIEGEPLHEELNVFMYIIAGLRSQRNGMVEKVRQGKSILELWAHMWGCSAASIKKRWGDIDIDAVAEKYKLD